MSDSPKYIPVFHLLLTPGRLTLANANDTARPGDWETQVRPTNEGYCVIAERLNIPMMRSVLAGA